MSKDARILTDLLAGQDKRKLLLEAKKHRNGTGTLGEENSDGNGEFAGEDARLLAVAMASPTEDNVALLFEHRYGNSFRYCKAWGQWLQWDTTRWRTERTDAALDFCRRLARAVNNANKSTIAKKSFAAGVEAFARAARCFATHSDQWDLTESTLNTPSGTEDL
jgi:hypothetical protein